jgi:hypothetical protein
MTFLRNRLGLIAIVAVVLMLVPAVTTVLVLLLGTSRGNGTASGTCGDAAYRVTTEVADSSEVFLELELVDRVPDRTWQVRWRDDRYGTYAVDVPTDASGRLVTRTAMGDIDDGDMLREVSFRPVGSEGWCTVRGHID